MEEVPYDMARFAEALAEADLVILSNTKFCEPFLAPVKESGKKLVVNFNGLDRENELDQKFLTVADIIYVSDDEIKSDPYEAMRIMSEEYSMECGILGSGKSRAFDVYKSGQYGGTVSCGPYQRSGKYSGCRKCAVILLFTLLS